MGFVGLLLVLAIMWWAKNHKKLDRRVSRAPTRKSYQPRARAQPAPRPARAAATVQPRTQPQYQPPVERVTVGKHPISVQRRPIGTPTIRRKVT